MPTADFIYSCVPAPYLQTSPSCGHAHDRREQGSPQGCTLVWGSSTRGLGWRPLRWCAGARGRTHQGSCLAPERNYRVTVTALYQQQQHCSLSYCSLQAFHASSCLAYSSCYRCACSLALQAFHVMLRACFALLMKGMQTVAIKSAPHGTVLPAGGEWQMRCAHWSCTPAALQRSDRLTCAHQSLVGRADVL